MKIIISLWLVAVVSLNVVHAQIFQKGIEATISTPFVWNKYEITNLIGSTKLMDGSGWSNGINLTFSKPVRKDFLLCGGVGFYKQNFDLHRPFDYPSPTYPLFTTRMYSYQNVQWIIGGAYRIKLGKRHSINCQVTYNSYSSFKQVYYTETANPEQVNHKNINLGSSINFALGMRRKIGEKFLMGADAMLPFAMKWRKDIIFRENTSEFHEAKASFGFSLSVTYLLKNHS